MSDRDPEAIATHDPAHANQPHGHGHHDHSHDHHDHSHGHHDHSHGHHDHSHGHHDHSHGHVPEGYAPKRRLERGDGKGRVLFFDAFSGIAGDMTVAALADLGVPPDVFEAAWAALPVDGYRVGFGHDERSGIVGTHLEVTLVGRASARTYGDIRTLLDEAADLDERARRTAHAIFRRLAESEAEMHRMPLEAVHFHEVGAVDAIVDVVGAAAGLAFLGADVIGSPLPMGRGFVRAQHGILPLPAPATVRCLAGVPTYAVDLDEELVTPTGAAIIATVADGYSRWPSMRPEFVGFGVGTKRFADRPNLLRAVLGSRVAEDDTADGEEPTKVPPRHVVVEANVDDLTGELGGHAIAALMAAGALDAWAIPTTTKKGRPALTLAALVAAEREVAIADVLLRETTTIGVRVTALSRRHERSRRLVTVTTEYGAVPVKVSDDARAPAVVKPEFDVCAALGEAAGVPVRVVVEAARSAYAGRDD
ncbi:MAG: nickel pincer cofactor biosynthesis protein LarC [Myxococcota bacterium]